MQRHWRTNDILWGRLDGAERLIAALLPAMDDDTTAVRRALTLEAHRAVLREALLPDGYGELTGLLCEAIAEHGNRTGKTSLLGVLVERLKPRDGATRRRLEQVVASLLDDDGLVKWVREKRDINREPEPHAVLDSASRAVTITGLVLQGVLKRHGHEQAGLRWMTRAGLAAQAMLAVAVPGSLKSRWWSHALKVLYAFELTALLIGLLLASEDMRNAALTALAVTGGAHFISLLLGDVLCAHRAWVSLLVLPVAGMLLLLAGVGVWTLIQVDWIQ